MTALPDSSSAAGGSSIHRRLRRETAEQHRRVERLLDLLGPDLTLRRYRGALQVLYGFYVPVEARLAQLTPVAPRLGVPLRARAGLLARDLVALGSQPEQLAGLPRCAELPRAARSEHFVGCLYVLEGACLGGQIVARAVHARLGLSAVTGAAFFVGDGDATAARWRSVLRWLAEVASVSAHTDEIVAAAGETFGALANWAQSNQCMERRHG